MLTDRDVLITADHLRIRKDEYRLKKILSIHAKAMTARDQIVRILSIAFAFSAIGWVIFAPMGLLLFAMGSVGALLTSKRYELRAEFRAVDESGDRVVPIARGRAPEEYALFQRIAQEVSLKLGSRGPT